MKLKTAKLYLGRETLQRLAPEYLNRAAAATGNQCYPPTFAPTCYVGCNTATCPGICN
ncbi:MAG TPA: hypothetical protein VN999_09295 [Thermoanaerobaculia bacterium]|nr:hypothetical protein [Thermoanaerobaculia bacterium]